METTKVSESGGISILTAYNLNAMMIGASIVIAYWKEEKYEK